PADEVSILMQLFLRTLEQEVVKLNENGIRFKVIGDTTRFEPRIRDLIAAGEALTGENRRLTLTVAANYGGRWDIAQAARRLLAVTLSALFWLPPRAWGAVTLFVVAVAAHEWANLCGYAQWARFGFVAGALAIGAYLLFGFMPGGSWPIAVTLIACGAATLFWLAVAPTWLASAWHVESKLVLAFTGWLVLLAWWIALVELQARSPA